MRAAIVFNSAVVGGAERSLICQLELMEEWQKTIYIPKTCKGSGQSVSSFFSGKNEVDFFIMPKAFSNLSRSRNIFLYSHFLGLASLVFSLLTNFKLKFREFDIVYCNGLKVMVLCLLHSLLSLKSKTYIFHFRDYLASQPVIMLFRFLCSYSSHHFVLVANSESVAQNLKLSLPELQVRVVYNIASVGGGNHKSQTLPMRPIRSIALASMMAPWKGVHWAIYSLIALKDELKELGIEEVNVYGGEIYQTLGEHQGYLKQCRNLVFKLNAEDLIKFRGLVSPQEIFRTNQVLIHSSIAAEPFGRVILEAFENGVSVISCALGGAAELVKHEENAQVAYPYDTLGLLTNLRKISHGVSFRANLLNNGYRYSDHLYRKSVEQIKDLISECKERKRTMAACSTKPGV